MLIKTGYRSLLSLFENIKSTLLLPTPGIIKTNKKMTVKELFMSVKAPVVTPSATGYVDSTVSS